MNVFIWNVGKQRCFKGFLDKISCYVYIQHLKLNTGVCALRYTENTLTTKQLQSLRQSLLNQIELSSSLN